MKLDDDNGFKNFFFCKQLAVAGGEGGGGCYPQSDASNELRTKDD